MTLAGTRCAWCSEVVAGIGHDHSLAEMYPEWQEEAACREAEVEAFFPDNGMSDRPAMLLCFDCPVRRECLDLALRRPERLGIWGGSTQSQRSSIRRLRLSPGAALEVALDITEDAARRRRLVA